MVYFEKTQPAPDSLATEKAKKSGQYNGSDVLELLKSDFKNKCYICEQKAPTSINVEHFKPHLGGKYLDLKFDWNNLFLSCEHCNKTKGAKIIFNHILNCTDKNHNVEQWISYEIKPFFKEKVTLKVIKDHIEKGENLTENTVTLLNQVYNGTTTQKTVEADNLRRLIVNEYLQFQKFVNDYLGDEADEDDKVLAIKKIKYYLSNKSPFTAFWRWIVRGNEVLNQEFLSYL